MNCPSRAGCNFNQPSAAEMQAHFATNDIYTHVAMDMKSEDTACPLSLATPDENSCYFDWIHVPVSRETTYHYSLADFSDYNIFTRGGLADPMRIYQSLRFMLTRLNAIYRAHPSLRERTIAEVTPALRAQLLAATMENWGQGGDLNEHNLLLSLETMFQNGLVHDINVEGATRMLLEGGRIGSFLLRRSGQGVFDGTSTCTVFTISYLSATGVEHVRLIDVHNVGVYITTSPPGTNINSFFIPRDDALLRNAQIQAVIQRFLHAPPQYACVADLLIAFSRQHRLFDLDKMVRVAPPAPVAPVAPVAPAPQEAHEYKNIEVCRVDDTVEDVPAPQEVHEEETQEFPEFNYTDDDDEESPLHNRGSSEDDDE